MHSAGIENSHDNDVTRSIVRTPVAFFAHEFFFVIIPSFISATNDQYRTLFAFATWLYNLPLLHDKTILMLISSQLTLVRTTVGLLKVLLVTSRDYMANTQKQTTHNVIVIKAEI